MAEQTYTIPLRKEVRKVPSYKRAKKAVSAVRGYLQKHMKAEEVKIGRYLNLKLWEHGIKNPPMSITVVATKDDEGVVTAEIPGAPVEKKKEKEKKTGAAAKEEKKAAAEKEQSQAAKEETKQQRPQQKEAAAKEELQSPQKTAAATTKKETTALPQKETGTAGEIVS